MTRSALVRFAFRTTIPVLLGYSTIGLAYGLLLATSGLPWWLAPLSSLVVYAGAAQFMAIPLLAGGAGIVEVAVLTFLVNARHLVYGLSLIKPFGEVRKARPYLIYALTDETYGLLTTVNPPEGASKARFFTLVSAFDQSYWVIGSLVGALAGSLVPASWTTGLDFALTALFIVLLVEQIRSVRRPAPYLVAIGASLVALLLAGPDRLLVVAIVLAMAGMLALKPLLRKATGGGSDAQAGGGSE